MAYTSAMKVLRKCFPQALCRRHVARLGFSLVEMSIVVLIIGVIAGSAVMVGMSRTESAKATANVNRMQRVEDALVAFVAINKYLPCPAVPTAAGPWHPTGNPTFGVSNCTATCTCTAVPCAVNSICRGMVPVTTLGIAEDMSLDGWGRRFTYMVDQRLTNLGYTASGPANFRDLNPNDADPVVAINAATLATNATATGLWIADVNGTLRSDDAAVVLVSHGPNGRCANTRTGGVETCASGANTAEQENGDCRTGVAPATGCDRGFQQSAGRTSLFDDVVRFLSKEQIIFLAGYSISGDICEKAARLVECDLSDPAVVVSGATVPTGPVGCEREDVAGTTDIRCTSIQMELGRELMKHCFTDVTYACSP